MLSEVENLAQFSNKEFNLIVQDKAARMHMEMQKGRNDGVFVLSREYARGYDLKLNKDAAVLILDTEGTLTFTEAKQMIGRASRAQGFQ